jgi:hypothetical protein
VQEGGPASYSQKLESVSLARLTLSYSQMKVKPGSNLVYLEGLDTEEMASQWVERRMVR